MADEVELVAYDPRWPERFAEEARLLTWVLPADLVCGLEHFGSTAIPGLVAKPVIDILIAVNDLAAARASFPELLEPLGYLFWAENPKDDRLFFVKGMPPLAPRRTHHVHVCHPDGEQWQRLVFRDYLRDHPDEARSYGDLKRRLAARFHDDREAYTTAKAEYVETITARARQQGYRPPLTLRQR